MSSAALQNAGAMADEDTFPYDLDQVEIHGPGASPCGYCRRGGRTSHSFSTVFPELLARRYEALVMCGWRRSGQLLYRPDLTASCCQLYVIRLAALRYVPSSTQKRVLRRLRRATRPHDETAQQHAQEKDACPRTARVDADIVCARVKDAVVAVLRALGAAGKLRSGAAGDETECVDPGDVEAAIGGLRVSRRQLPKKRAKKPRKGGENDDEKDGVKDVMKEEGGAECVELATNAAMAVIGARRKRQKTPGGKKSAMRSGWTMELARIVADALAADAELRTIVAEVTCANPGWINMRLVPVAAALELQKPEASRASVHGTKLGRGTGKKGRSAAAASPSDSEATRSGNLNSPPSGGEPHGNGNGVGAACDSAMLGDEWCSGRDEEAGDGGDKFEMDYSELDMPGDDIEPSVLSRIERTPAAPIVKRELAQVAGGRKFSMTLRQSSFFLDEYKLFRRYQMSTHDSALRECTVRSYRRFLVDTPVKHEYTQGGPTCGYGSFHVRYCLDGELFAVGVVDVLPHCVSSVYLFYNPEFSSLSPGVLSGMQEIAWVESLRKDTPEMQYYVMGYYIHTCPKMAYKGDFYPSEILCEDTRHWVPVARARAVLSEAAASGVRTTRLAPPEVRVADARAPFDIAPGVLSALVDRTVVLLTERVCIMQYSVLEGIVRERNEMMARRVRNYLEGFAQLVGKDLFQEFLLLLS